MDPTIASIFHLSPAEKLQLVLDLWDDLAAAPHTVPVHDWQLAEVERRREAMMSDPNAGVKWDEFERRLYERYGR